MKRLIDTPFCQSFDRWQELFTLNREVFFSYYEQFREEVVLLLNDYEEGETPIYLTLSYTEYELKSHYNQLSDSTDKVVLEIVGYLNRAIYIVEMAKKLVTLYLKNCMVGKNKIRGSKRLKLQWTGKPIELVELVYGLWVTRSINDGDFDLKTTLETVGKLMGVEIKNYYHLYSEMRNRTKSRTLYLDKLKEKLEDKMDRDDDKKSQRTI